MIPRISRNAVKEGFDTLPAAICYFDRNGLLRLINHRMQEIAAVLCGRDLQTLTDLEQALRSPGGGVRLRDEAARIYEFPDGTVYHFTVRPVQDKYGIPYTEVMATDVTQLATLHAALQQENERLAAAHRLGQRTHCFFQRGVRIHAVVVKNIHIVQPHAAQALIQAGQQVFAAAPVAVRAVPHFIACFGGNNQLIAVNAKVIV